MGGRWSGRRSSWRKKTTVEDCHALSVGTFREAIKHGPGHSGRVWWTQGEKEVASIGYRIDAVGGFLAVRLVYTSTDPLKGEKTESNYPILLQATYPHLGGRRWWFTCPLVADGVPCRRRVGRLYLPPNGTYFGCRHCYDLTYESRQTWDKRVALYRKHPELLHVDLQVCNRLGVSGPMVLARAIGERAQAQREFLDYAVRGAKPPKRLRGVMQGGLLLPLRKRPQGWRKSTRRSPP